MKKKMLAVLLAAIMILGFMPQTAKADNSVTVYLSLTDDSGFLTDTAGKAIALREISVPYFDLGVNYGLSDFYFNTENYGNADPDDPYSHYSDLEPGTQQNALNKVTLLHLMIYAMEVYQLGIDPTLAGQGQLKPYMELDDGYDPTNSFSATAGDTMISISGTPGSIFFETYWNMDNLGTVPYNWMYFKNYTYPTASAGWGATADQILLSTGNTITIGHFGEGDDYDPMPNSHAYARLANEGITRWTRKAIGTPVSIVFGRATADAYGTYTTTQADFNQVVPVYRFDVNSTTLNGISTSANWTPVGSTNAAGAITIDTSGWTAGTYMVTIPGVQGDIYQWGMCVGYGYICTPGGILIEVY